MRRTLTALVLVASLGVLSVGCAPEAPKKPQTPAASPAATAPKDEGSQTKSAAPKEEGSQTKSQEPATTAPAGGGSGTK